MLKNHHGEKHFQIWKYILVTKKLMALLPQVHAYTRSIKSEMNKHGFNGMVVTYSRPCANLTSLKQIAPDVF